MSFWLNLALGITFIIVIILVAAILVSNRPPAAPIDTTEQSWGPATIAGTCNSYSFLTSNALLPYSYNTNQIDQAIQGPAVACINTTVINALALTHTCLGNSCYKSDGTGLASTGSTETYYVPCAYGTNYILGQAYIASSTPTCTGQLASISIGFQTMQPDQTTCINYNLQANSICSPSNNNLWQIIRTTFKDYPVASGTTSTGPLAAISYQNQYLTYYQDVLNISKTVSQNGYLWLLVNETIWPAEFVTSPNEPESLSMILDNFLATSIVLGANKLPDNYPKNLIVPAGSKLPTNLTRSTQQIVYLGYLTSYNILQNSLNPIYELVKYSLQNNLPILSLSNDSGLLSMQAYDYGSPIINWLTVLGPISSKTVYIPVPIRENLDTNQTAQILNENNYLLANNISTILPF